MVPRFAPAFDNGTSLLHEIMEDRLHQFQDPAVVARYVQRGRHHIRLEQDDQRQVGHIDLLKNLLTARPLARQIISDAVSFELNDLEQELTNLTEFVCATPLSEERASSIINVISHRKQSIETALEATDAL
jgi:hypothetical protein